jgi:hypothetical protein
VLPVLGEHAERPALVIGEDKVVRVQADGGSVLAGPVPGGFGVGVVGVRALSKPRESGIPTHYRATRRQTRAPRRQSPPSPALRMPSC